MKLANIYPVKNQQFYQGEEYVMILAHLVKKGLYNARNFNEHQYIIMDNGLYEEEQVSTGLEDVIMLAEKSGIPVNEIIVPDVLNEVSANIELFKKNEEVVRKYGSKYRFMFVAQAKNYEELSRAIDFINSYNDLNLAVGISKLAPFNRSSSQAREIYKKCKYPIHLLGLKESFEELVGLEDLVRGCDSSQLAYIVKNEPSMPQDMLHYVRKGRRADGRGIEGVDIDLEHDELSNSRILSYRLHVPSFETKLEKYQTFVREGASPKYTKELSIIGLVGEVGELADVVKKETIYEDMSKFIAKYGMSVREKIIDEVGDSLWQLVLVMCKYDVSFGEVVDHNVAKLLKRHGGVQTAKDGGGERWTVIESQTKLFM